MQTPLKTLSFASGARRARPSLKDVCSFGRRKRSLISSIPRSMQTFANFEIESAQTRSRERNSGLSRFELVVVFFFALAAALNVFVETNRTIREQSFVSVSGVPSTPTESSQNAIPRLSAIVGDSSASLSETLRLRTRCLGRFRLARVARSSRGGSSLERQPSFRASFRFLCDRFHVSLELFSRLWREKTSPRPLWLFILVLLN